MIHSPTKLALGAAVLLATAFSATESQAQVFAPVYVAPAPVVTVYRPRVHHHRRYYPAAVPVTVNYATYYAPQVPVAPVVYGAPVATVSAYYVPTVPVARTCCAPVVTKKVRRHRSSYIPTAVHPVYWLPPL